ncbi:hypothetical protein [Elizabethkingia meningoseptica]|uniref:hypothetical protein n=1 Tax=Elizabethkingia meningoseptica TaxID=238 RepID=UPI0009362BF1|nr:hypothetical protein [Elizabethkingia meningoseptica]
MDEKKIKFYVNELEDYIEGEYNVGLLRKTKGIVEDLIKLKSVDHGHRLFQLNELLKHLDESYGFTVGQLLSMHDKDIILKLHEELIMMLKSKSF